MQDILVRAWASSRISHGWIIVGNYTLNFSYNSESVVVQCSVWNAFSYMLNPVSLGQWKDRYEINHGWENICVGVLCRNWRLFRHIFIASFKVPYRWTFFPRFSLLRGLSSAFTGTFPLWSSLSFTSSLSSVPSTTSPSSLSHSEVSQRQHVEICLSRFLAVSNLQRLLVPALASELF